MICDFNDFMLIYINEYVCLNMLNIILKCEILFVFGFIYILCNDGYDL